MQVQPTPDQNPESLLEASSLSYSGVLRKNYRLANKRNLIEECQSILKKPYENRSPSQTNILLKLLERNQLLKNLSQNISLDFVKGIFRNAKIEIIDEKQVIAEEDDDLNYMVIILDGKLGIEKSSFHIPQKTIESGKGKETIDASILKTEQVFQKLTMMAKKSRDQQKAHSKLQRKSSLPVSHYDLHLPILTESDYSTFLSNIEKTIGTNEEYGARDILTSKSYKNRVAALQKTTLLVIEIEFLFYWLQSAFKAKLSKNIELLKTITCFEHMEEEKLSQIILSMKLNKKRRNDVVYSQGDEAENVFILLEGEIKLMKKAHLFKENPNDFYVDRQKLVQQLNQGEKQYRSKSLKKDDDVLPFANFTTMYNYRPIRKVIQIGVISSFGLFGEEEVVFQTPRQTTAVVNCLQAVYFQIQYKKILEIVGAKNVEPFKKKLEHSISKKILYRQSEFAEHISLQNKNNLDYFYLEEGKQKQSSRKIKLEKINQKMAARTSRESKGNSIATYTSFNFNKLLTNKRYSEDKYENRKTKKTHQSSKESLNDITLDPTEEILVGNSHSWVPIEKKVKQEKLMSRRISPFKHQISIDAPLIDQQYFRFIAKETQRLNKEFRTARLGIAKRPK